MEFLSKDSLKKLGKDVIFGRVPNEDRGPNPMSPITKYDPFFHLRSDKRDSEIVLDLLKKENDYAKESTKHLKYFSEKLYEKILSHIDENERSVPHMYKKYWFWSTTKKGLSYDIYWRKLVTKNSKSSGKPEIILDVNKLAKGKKFCDIGTVSIHPTKNWLLYTVDFKGDEIYKPYFLNLSTETKKYIYTKDTESFPKIDDIIWGTNQSLFYTTTDDAHRPNKIWYYNLGSSSHTCIYTDNDPLFNVGLSKSDSERFIFISSESTETSEVWHIDLKDSGNSGKLKLNLILKRKKGITYDVEHQGAYFYMITNKGNTNLEKSQNNKIMRYNISTKKLTDFKKYDPKIFIESLQTFKKFVIIQGRENASTRMWFVDTSKSKNDWVPIESEGKYKDISLGTNENYDTDIIQIDIESFTIPEKVFNYNVFTKDSKLIWEKPVPNYDPSKYAAKRVFVKSRDNKETIPMYIVHRKDLDLSKTNPTILYSYGAYGTNLDPDFSVYRTALLDLGIIYCVANIRGGSEKGRYWYEDSGKYLKKKNTFYDFIDCIDYLNETYTEPSKLGIVGRSAGGLLMGAVLNMAPEKFAVALCGVPFVDVINTMSDSSIPLTSSEWEEVGNPNEKKYFKYMESYSPYDNVKKQKYPSIIVTAGLWDYRVQYWEPLKWITKLRHLNRGTDNLKAILKVNMDAGHFSTTDRYDIIRERAWEFAIVCEVIGVTF
jgi:oligopeptidase B